MRTIRMALLIFGILAIPWAAFAAQDAPTPRIYLGLHGGGGRSLQTVELLTPLLWRNDNLWFADLRATNSSSATQEYNVGAGLRHLIPGRGVLGGYAYYDHLHAAGHFFDQATVGMEWLGKRFD
ncbi:MAG: hypothetical protein B7Z66_14440, partial [Chromatiales bacterium 21-64-14]